MIADILRRGKGFLPTLLILATVVLVGVAAFGLGRLSGLTAGDKGLIITLPPEAQEERADYAP